MKESGVFCFDGGQVQIRRAGHGDRDGSGFFQFEEADVTWQEHDGRYTGAPRVESTNAHPNEMVDLADALRMLGKVVPGDEYASVSRKLENPTDVYDALTSIGAVPTRWEKLPWEPNFMGAQVRLIGPRMRFLTDPTNDHMEAR